MADPIVQSAERAAGLAVDARSATRAALSLIGDEDERRADLMAASNSFDRALEALQRLGAPAA